MILYARYTAEYDANPANRNIKRSTSVATCNWLIITSRTTSGAVKGFNLKLLLLKAAPPITSRPRPTRAPLLVAAGAGGGAVATS